MERHLHESRSTCKLGLFLYAKEEKKTEKIKIRN